MKTNYWINDEEVNRKEYERYVGKSKTKKTLKNCLKRGGGASTTYRDTTDGVAECRVVVTSN